MRKELTVYVSSNEEGEEIKVSRLNTEPEFILLTLGMNRMVVNIAELMEAVGAIGHYSTLFDQESKMRELAKKAPPKTVVSEQSPSPISAPRANKKGKEPEGTFEMDAIVRSGPTESELALANEMTLMQGAELIVKEKK